MKVEGGDGELALRRTIRLKMVDLPEWLNDSKNNHSKLFLLFLYFATESDIHRDTGTQPGKSRKTYSLARTQMAVWTLTIIIDYVFIWMVISDFSSLTSGILGLMGISAFTGLASAVVDSKKENEQIQQRREHEEKKRLPRPKPRNSKVK